MHAAGGRMLDIFEAVQPKRNALFLYLDNGSKPWSWPCWWGKWHSFPAWKMCLIAQVVLSKMPPISRRQTETPCFSCLFLPISWGGLSWQWFEKNKQKAHRCDCAAFRARSSLERRRQSKWLLARAHPPSQSASKAFSGEHIQTLLFPTCTGLSVWVRTITVWK